MCNSGGTGVSGDLREEDSSPQAADQELLLAQFLLTTSKAVSMENSIESMTGVDMESANWTDVITGPFAAPIGILLRSEMRERTESVKEETCPLGSNFHFLSLKPPEEEIYIDQDTYLLESNLNIRKAWEMFLSRKSGVAH